MCLIIVLFKVSKVMKNIAHHKFVEEDDTKQSSPSDYSRNGLFGGC